MFLCLPTSLVCDGVLLVSVTPCPLIYSVYTLLCTVTGGRADRRRAPRVSAPRGERESVQHINFSVRTECGGKVEGSTGIHIQRRFFFMLWQAHTRPKRTLTSCYMWRSAPCMHTSKG